MCLEKVLVGFEIVSASVRVGGWVVCVSVRLQQWQSKNETCTLRVSCVLLDCGGVGMHFGD